MFESVLQVLAYTGVGLAMLVAGFYRARLMTPGKLGTLVMEGNPGAGLLAGVSLVSLGLILFFAIFFTGAGWDGLDDALVFGIVGVVAQAVGVFILDLLIPGKLAEHCFEPTLHPAAWATAGDSAVGRADRLRVADVAHQRGSGASSPRSIECTSSTTSSLHGVGMPSSRPRVGDAAVDDVDLGRAARLEVLQHRGLDVRGALHHALERRVGEVVRLDPVDRLSSRPCASPTATPSAQSANTRRGPPRTPGRSAGRRPPRGR